MSDYPIRTFDSNLSELYKTMDSAWAADYTKEPRLDYTAEYLRWHFDAPGVDKDLLVAAYDSDRVIGFGSSFPRRLTLRGTPVQATLSTFFTVHEEYRRQRLGWRLVEERLRRNREKGVQAFFVYLQHGHASHPLYERLGRETGIRVEKVFTVCSRSRILDSSNLSERAQKIWTEDIRFIPEPPDFEGTVRKIDTADLPRCRQMLNSFQQSVPLARVWTSEEELAWQLDHPPHSTTLVLEVDRDVAGLINWSVIGRITKARDHIAYVDNMRLDDLDKAQAWALVIAVLTSMRKQGCRFATISSPPYCDESILHDIGFIEVDLLLDLYAVVLDPQLDLSGLDRIYLDQR